MAEELDVRRADEGSLVPRPPSLPDPDALLDQALSRARTRRPVTTYRVQLNASFGFEKARAVVPYLHALGVTDLYVSPFLQAKPGSTHGYDVVDHRRINPEIGTEEELRALADTLRAHDMGMLVDVVPNHVGIGRENARWLDVLENGIASIHARFFDIDWAPMKPELQGKVLLPILGDQYGAVLERGELRLSFEGGAFWLAYWEERLPIAPRSYIAILRHGLAALEQTLGPDDVQLQELLSIITALENLPPRATTAPAKVIERHREKEVVKRRLAQLHETSDVIRSHIEQAVVALNGNVEDPASFDLLDAVLDQQAYRLAYWRVAGEEINYRRFFDINGLAAIRQEDPVVFEETHRTLLSLLGDGVITGMRIDHPDGLYDPTEYLRSLQEEVVLASARPLAGESFASLEPELRRAFRQRIEANPSDPTLRPLYVVVEKILSRKERVPDSWAIEGTTGYEFLNLLNGLFVDKANCTRLDDTYARAVGERVDFHALVRKNKRMIMKTAMVSELNVLAHRLSALSERSRRTRDFTLNSLRHALIEFVACFPIYRTYVSSWDVDERDRTYIEQAIAEARAGGNELSAQTYDFLRSILLMEPILGHAEETRREHLAFVMKLQQVTGPVMAKGLEDTTFYVYNRLVSLNEVGGEPEHFGVSVEAFHRANRSRATRWPASMLASSTHDTKRSEDVRARIDVLSELPDAWARFLEVALEQNESRKVRLGDKLAPDPAEEVLFYQTLLGAAPTWPIAEGERASFRERIVAYMLKAVKEAKVNNSWTNHRPEYDDAITRFVTAVLDTSAGDPFWEEMRSLHRRVVRVGRVNAIAQQLLKLASPGVPDLYQGTESWDLSLVDPDNRRPVDYDARRAMLDEIVEMRKAGSAERNDARLKLFVTHCALSARRDDPALFCDGAYLPLDVVGARAKHVVAFARVLDGRVAIAVVPRLVASLLGDREAWRDTYVTMPEEVEAEGFVDHFTGATIRVLRREGVAALSVADLFSGFPLALLTSKMPDRA